MPFSRRFSSPLLRRSQRFCLALMLLVVSLFSAHTLAQSGREGASAERQSDRRSAGNGSVDGVGITYVATTVLSVQTDSTIARSFTGTLVARRMSELGCKRIGRIERLLADRGDKVRKGQVLAELDTAMLVAEKNVLLAQRESANARLAELVAGPRKQTIDAARARLVELEAVGNQLHATYQRRQRLIGSDAISVQAVDDARHQLEAAEAKIRAQQYTVAELQEGTRKEQLAAQRSEVSRLDASIDSVDVQIRESQLFAPYDAVVSQRLVDEGAIVQPGLTMFKIIELAPYEAWIGVPPELCANMLVGDEFPLALHGKPLKGRLKSIMPELDTATRTRTAIFELNSSNRADSAPGQPLGAVGEIVNLNLVQSVPQAGFWLPLSALTRGVKGLWSVYVVNESDSRKGEYIVRRSDVEIVQIDSNRVLINGTVRSGDRVVSSGVQRLTPGQRVRLMDRP